VVAAISHEFTRAAAGHHASVAYWRQAYADNPLLDGVEPAAMRVVSAKIHLPIAIASKESTAPRPLVMDRLTIRALLPSRLDVNERERVAQAVHQDLAKRGQERFDDPKLATHLKSAVRRTAPGVERELDLAALERIRRSSPTLAHDDAQLSVVYRAEDLARVGPDSIVRIELNLALE
jgi:hypothetical protein